MSGENEVGLNATVISREKEQSVLKVREKSVLWEFPRTTAEEQTGCLQKAG